MIQLNNVDVVITENDRVLISGLSFTLNSCDRIAIIGEEGNGKSSLLKLIFDPNLVESHISWSGTILKSNHRVGYLSQEMGADALAMPVYSYMEEYAEISSRNPGEISRLCSKLGIFPEMLWDNRPFITLSGGERVKLRLICLLLNSPDTLLLDEPTNDIDIETLEWLELFINGFEGGVLFVSHDETLLENIATGVIHIEHVHHKKICRHTVARIPYRKYIESRSQSLAKQEQVAKKERDEQKKREERWHEIYEKVDKAQRNTSRGDPSTGRLLKKKMHSVISMGKRLDRERENMTDTPVTELSIFLDLPSVSLPPQKEILRLKLNELKTPTNAEGYRILSSNIELSVNASEHIAIIGENGTGKTTLLRIIANELIHRKDIRTFYMPQDYSELLPPHITPVEFLAPSGKKDDITVARTYMGSMRYTADEMESAVSELSGGQKAKLLFAKMALDGYDVLILDEPTRNFSPLSTPVIRKVLREFGGCIIGVTHDRKYLEEVCSKVYRLTENGLSLT